MRSWQRVADLELQIDAVGVKGLVRTVASGFERHTSVVRLSGRGLSGLGEDVTWDAADQLKFSQRGGAGLALRGRWTLSTLSARLDELDLFADRRPSHPSSLDYRRWAVESAALDLALRQSGRSLADALGRRARPVSFVVSRGLGDPPDASRVESWLEVDAALRFKLDASSSWDDALVARLAATGAVSTIDFKGAYRGTPVDQAPDAALYSRVLRAFPEAWIEDPAFDEATRAVLEPALPRVTWDAPIHCVGDIESLEVQPRMVNIKPSRFGTIERLLDVYDHCEREGIDMYGGGQFELGPGRGQIQLLAGLWHADAPNDVAPTDYNVGLAREGLPASPLDTDPCPVGFARTGDAR